MKIIYLNVFEECKEEDRLDRIVSFIKEESPDVLAISEISSWDESRIKDFAQRINLEHHYKKEHIAVFSSVPFTNSKHIRDGIVKVKIKVHDTEFSIIAAHLKLTEDHRLPQVDSILKEISLDDNIILLGDLNSLSPLDGYNDEELLKKLKKIKLTKFGTKNIRKEVQQNILDFGMIDSLREFSQEFEWSAPTEFNTDPSHFQKLRLDYIYITPPLKKSLKSSRIIRTNETNQLSDHFPVVAEFDFLI